MVFFIRGGGSILNLSQNLSRLAISSNFMDSNKCVPYLVRTISTTPLLLAEPMKRKRKMDPAVVRLRDDRKKKKLEKEIRRLQKRSGQLKPLDECEIPEQIIENPKSRERKLPQFNSEQMESRWKIQKQWNVLKCSQVKQEMLQFDRLYRSQIKALDELKMCSEELYQHAISIDESLIPYVSKGPVDTPPKTPEDYKVPQGDYIDISKNWEDK